MINQVYQLVSPRQFEVTYNNEDINSNKVIVRPLYLSICAADQRYYTGSRAEDVLKKKLPMSLIHEAVGEVVYDSQGMYDVGTKVIMVPNTPTKTDEIIAENYLPTSKFRSSGYDGFMQDYVFMDHDRVVEIDKSISDLSTIAYSELVTVSWHALQRFEKKSHANKNRFAIWGDGNLGYITAILLRKKYPDAEIYVFGKTDYKLRHFSFVTKTFHIYNIPDDLTFDHAFECVGGKGSQSAVEQIIDHISPEGTISLLGVTEYPIEVNTRLVLEKGLTMYGSSRSGAQDFREVAQFYKDNPDVVEKLSLLKGNEFEVKTINDVIQAFESDLSTSWGKTTLKWVM
ncbi:MULTISPECIES: alcohol dehydrogenase catalytic domain-containing protein [unclassified Staphylococcus]|uniref:alcohol dehydrogenase catalytic domain-containing protein n=1 Tax=unclassified Staphylococcus TaxID=91994 RepID=UPI0021D3536B|nr:MULTISPECIES: alcohol dehydrogenase catalytic domain-containing protein [unclassified Staphylococcus]UXR71997.1 alcohol dehydrogenase catalytic domain-containing protein [Staphylococcus sp. IVB6240]UXR74304.1 alcohol dehydrogenase catalytic domain-containing protein [Staphylococcus sp. IVB6238]UXR76690.1 alcohol dehydrogenase catalytic domain-containing protein [Staphylococcus sp. IVB6233]UXR80819.1 alcohol dehydrogenase catalytic domain-containing protein [Staphylococcus sp. IVB6218]